MSDRTDLQRRILQVCRPVYLPCLGGNTLIYASQESVSVQPLMGDFPDLLYQMKVIIAQEKKSLLKRALELKCGLKSCKSQIGVNLC